MFRADSRLAFVAACALVAACSGQPHGAATRVIIPRGASFAQAADSLARTGLIGSPRMFRLYGRVTGGERNIKPGTYLLKHGTPWKDIVSALNGGHGLVNTITIPEGYTLSQITPLLARTLRVPMDSVQAAVRDTALLARLDIPNPTLEGYVFPDTYALPVGTTARQAVREMVYSFERRWKPEWDSSLVDLKINRNDLVTMASIVEREARLPEERPVIAAVYYNRLRKGMLPGRPTIQYALGHRRPSAGREIWRSHRRTPIHKACRRTGGIASAASLTAAANPPETSLSVLRRQWTAITVPDDARRIRAPFVKFARQPGRKPAPGCWRWRRQREQDAGEDRQQDDLKAQRDNGKSDGEEIDSRSSSTKKRSSSRTTTTSR
jgi:UPF0755 protein